MRISDWSSDVCSSDLDRRGFPVVRGEVVALSPSAASLAKAQSAGFAIARSEVLEALGVTLVTLRTPEGLRAREARSEEHTSELQSLMRISYAVFCLKKI